MLAVGRPGLAPNTSQYEQLMAVGLPARLPGGAQTPAHRGQAGLGQATKQGGVARFNLTLADQSLDAGPGWPGPPFQTRAWF